VVELARGFTIGGYLLVLLMGMGYAKLLIARPGERKAAFVVVWLTCTVALFAAFRLWVEPQVLRQFAQTKVEIQLQGQPGLREVSRRHPEIKAALGQVAAAQVRGAGSADAALIAAQAAYAEALGKYRSAYLAIAGDQELLDYISALAATLSEVNERSGFICGAILQGDMATIVGTINASSSSNWSDLATAYDAALASAFARPHALLPAARASKLDADLTQFLNRRYGPLRAQVLLNAMAAPAPADDPELCTALVAMAEYSLALPEPDREDMIRMLFQEAALARSETGKATQPDTSTL
jgi:TM2 domain-containing membrane protein YozV